MVVHLLMDSGIVYLFRSGCVAISLTLFVLLIVGWKESMRPESPNKGITHLFCATLNLPSDLSPDERQKRTDEFWTALIGRIKTGVPSPIRDDPKPLRAEARRSTTLPGACMISSTMSDTFVEFLVKPACSAVLAEMEARYGAPVTCSPMLLKLTDAARLGKVVE